MLDKKMSVVVDTLVEMVQTGKYELMVSEDKEGFVFGSAKFTRQVRADPSKLTLHLYTTDPSPEGVDETITPTEGKKNDTFH